MEPQKALDPQDGSALLQKAIANMVHRPTARVAHREANPWPPSSERPQSYSEAVRSVRTDAGTKSSVQRASNEANRPRPKNGKVLRQTKNPQNPWWKRKSKLEEPITYDKPAHKPKPVPDPTRIVSPTPLAPKPPSNEFRSGSKKNDDNGWQVPKKKNTSKAIRIYGCKASSRRGYGAEDLKYLTRHIKDAHGKKVQSAYTCGKCGESTKQFGVKATTWLKSHLQLRPGIHAEHRFKMGKGLQVTSAEILEKEAPSISNPRRLAKPYSMTDRQMTPEKLEGMIQTRSVAKTLSVLKQSSKKVGDRKNDVPKQQPRIAGIFKPTAKRRSIGFRKSQESPRTELQTSATVNSKTESPISIKQRLCSAKTNFFPICEKNQGMVAQFINELNRNLKWFKTPVPSQKDAVDCGVHVCLVAKSIVTGSYWYDERDVTSFWRSMKKMLVKRGYEFYSESPEESKVRQKSDNAINISDDDDIKII
ncbi:unnamed protein product [Caenorhabditis nigoni]